MRQALYIIIVLLFSNCEISKTNNIMDKNSPEYKAYMAQEYRFEINGCALKYNGKPFNLGMTIKEMENVFGKYDERLLWKNNKRLLNKNEKRLFWKNENLDVTFSSDRAIYIYI